MTDVPHSAAPRPTSDIASFHAHVYYDPATTRSEAETLRSWIGERFPVTLGRWHDVKVGPQPAQGSPAGSTLDRTGARPAWRQAAGTGRAGTGTSTQHKPGSFS